MNILEILSGVEKHDPEIYERLNTRREAMRDFANIGKKVALTALPFALGSMFQKAYGQTPSPAIIAVFNYALTLEYLEYRFYQTGVDSVGLIPTGAPLNAISSIRNNEQSHVSFLRSTITQLGGTPIDEPTFDFTGGNGTGNGPFKGLFGNYELFLGVAQVFEDTGVRAYKGQAGALLSQGDLLEAALNIHSVEARHASHIRQMRKFNNFGDVKPWITLKEPGLGAANQYVQGSYDGEEVTTQLSVNIAAISAGGISIDAEAASESFDEPLSMTQVLAIVDGFIVP